MRIEVASVTYALETVDQKIILAIEDDDDMPGVTLTVSEDTISENGGTSNLTATLSTASGRDVSVGLVMEGTAGSKDFTVGGNEIDLSEIITDGLLLTTPLPEMLTTEHLTLTMELLLVLHLLQIDLERLTVRTTLMEIRITFMFHFQVL